jgi:hypothetical protein
VHGTTIIENKDASFNCDSLDNETLNDNCGDIVQLQLSPPSKLPIQPPSPQQHPTPNHVQPLQQPLSDQPPPNQHPPPEGQLLQKPSSEQQLIQISNTGLPSMDTAETAGPEMFDRHNQHSEEKEEGILREEKSDDENDGAFLREEDELQHPAAIYITQSQLNAEKNLANNAEIVHNSPHNESFPIQVAGTTFNLSSFHFTTDNNSVTLYNDTRKSRLEYIDFSRPQLYLYMWDRRHAVSLPLKSPVTGRYQTRFYLAMTNLCMSLDETGESINEELVLLDILNRLDPYAYIDAVVGVVATGEVRLWQYSLNHLRFSYCDFRRPLKRGEHFWFAKLQQFYSERGLLYLIQRLIPRDLDAPKNRFANNKEYITHYKHNIKTIPKAEENFKKWLVLPGKNKSEKEKTEDLKALFSRTNKGKSSSSDPPPEKTKAQIEQEQFAANRKTSNEKRKATIQAKKEERVAAAKAQADALKEARETAAKVQADALKEAREAAAKAQADASDHASSDGLARFARTAATAAVATTRATTGNNLSKAINKPQVY